MRNTDASYGDEIYVAGCDIEDVLPWLESLLGLVQRILESDNPTGRTQMFDGARAGLPVRAVIAEQTPDAPWTKVLFGGPGCIHLPWTTEVTMAQAAFAALGRAVRCDPGPLAHHGPLSDEFWQIDAHGERLVIWGD